MKTIYGRYGNVYETGIRGMNSAPFIQNELLKNELNQLKMQVENLKEQKYSELLRENKRLKEQVIDISNCIRYRNVNSAIQQQVLSYQIELENHYKIKYHELHNNWNKLKEYINKYIKYDNDGRKISKCLNAIVIMNKINKLEKGSDSDE